MERASLRPVPTPPPSDVDPGEAFAHVSTKLPGLDEPARRALAMVELAGLSRGAAAERLELGADAISQVLARARKALRRATFPLNASGWCERAERLISDRLDGALAPPDPARLEGHLGHCDRCVEHERRLEQARDSLVRGFVTAREAAAAASREPTVEESAAAEPPPAVEPPPPVEPPPAVEAPPAVEPPPPVEPPAPAPPEPAARPASPVAPLRNPPPAAAKRPPATAKPAAAVSEPRGAGKWAIAAAWSFMFALVIVLALVSVVLVVLGASGVNVV